MRFLAFLLLSCSCFGQAINYPAAVYQTRGAALLPDDRVTPGIVKLKDKYTICHTKWGKDERAVTPEMKTQVYALYGVKPGEGICKPVTHTAKNGKPVTAECEVDHRVPRDAGGADVIANLWIQPYLVPGEPGAYSKDHLEVWTHQQLCDANAMTVEEVQRLFLGDWLTAYEKYIGPLPNGP